MSFCGETNELVFNDTVDLMLAWMDKLTFHKSLNWTITFRWPQQWHLQ